MVQTKKCKVVLLPTSDSTNVYINKYDILVYDRFPCGNRTKHIYFISNEETQESDWWYHVPTQQIGNTPWDPRLSGKRLNELKINFKKIVAPTDASLGLPNIPEEFIREYVAANGAIDEVELRVTSKNKHGNTLVLTKNNTEVVIATGSDVIKQENDKILDQLRSSDKSAYKPVPVEEQQAAKEYASKFLGFHVYTAEEAFKAGIEWYKNNQVQ